MTKDLTTGDYRKVLIAFAVPFLMAYMLQSLYGSVDLFVVGRFDSSSAIASVNIGSQIMQMISSFIIGCSVGTTVLIGRAVGAADAIGKRNALASSIKFFALFALIATPIMLIISSYAVEWMQTPADAYNEALVYVRICACGIPAIILFNVTSAVFRSLGDSKTPMKIVFAACIINIGGDFLLTGLFDMGAAGVAIATSAAQYISGFLGLYLLRDQSSQFHLSMSDITKSRVRSLLSVGLPIAMQDTLINISFMVLTVIANQRGLTASSAVGIVEKLITFMFLIPSSMLSAITAVTSQNIGAGKPERAKKSLYFGIAVTVSFGILMCLLANTIPSVLTSIFTNDADVIIQADQYIGTYSIDCILVGFTFCINGYLCGTERSSITFMHNVISIFAVRIPSAWLLSKLFPDSLSPMGLASPLGSVMSIIILAIWYTIQKKKKTVIA